VFLRKKNSLASYNMHIEVHQKRCGFSEDRVKEQKDELVGVRNIISAAAPS
jgi:hypothetical protein